MRRSLLSSRVLLRSLWTSPRPDVALPPPTSTLPDLIWANLESKKEKPAFAAAGKTFSYGRLKRLSFNFGAWLNGQLGDQQIFTVLLPNSIELAIACLGAFEAGVTLSPLNPDYTPEELTQLLSSTKTTHLVTYSKKIPEVLEARRAIEEATKAEFPLTIISIDDDVVFRGVLHFDDLLRGWGPFTRHSNPTAAIFLSLNDKGAQEVQVSHRSMMANVLQVSSVAPYQEGSVVGAVLPLFHGFGLSQLLVRGLVEGAMVVAFPRFDPQQCINHLKQYSVRALPIAASMAHYLAAESVVKEDLAGLESVTVAGAPVAASAERLRSLVKGRVLTCYGLTEGSVLFHEGPPGGERPGSVGQLLGSTEAKIIDSSGREIKFGEGEIWVRGPQLSEGGEWLRSGDVGHADEEGHFFVTARLKDTIRTHMYRVSPYEVERVILQHPQVKDTVVFGVSQGGVGECPVALVVPSTSSLSAKEIKNFVASRLAPYKHLSDVVLQDSIPRNADGSVDRKLLAAEYTVRNEYVSLSYV